MKSNARVCIQEGATVEPETLIERGSAQEVNRERRRGGRGAYVCVWGGGNIASAANIRCWLNIFIPPPTPRLKRAAKFADVDSERR